MKKVVIAAAAALFAMTAAVAWGAGMFHEAKAKTYDPAKTSLVSTGWANGIGCPTGQPIANYPSTTSTGTYTDPGCPTGDTSDKKNEGLLFNKVGPSSNNAASQVELKDLNGQTISEVGYDLRKVNGNSSPNGSQCDVQAPLWDIVTTDGHEYVIGCDTGTVTSGGTPGTSAFERLRWGGSSPIPAYDSANGYTPAADIRGATIKNAYLVYYSGSDVGATYFGAAIVDNIDVNGTLVGDGDHGDLG